MPLPFDHIKPVVRVVQHNQKRYSLRLEQIYWNTLSDLATNQKKRIGQLVSELHDDYAGDNFSSYVRVYCLLTLQQTTALPTNSKQAIAFDMFKTAPSAGLIINSDGVIVDINNAFHKWMRTTQRYLNSHFTDFFVPLRGRSFESTLELMVAKRLKRTEMPVNYTRETTHKQTSMITLLDISDEKTAFFRALIWFNTQPALNTRIH